MVETVKALYPWWDTYGELYHEEVLTADKEASAAVRLLIFGLEELLNIKKELRCSRGFMVRSKTDTRT